MIKLTIHFGIYNLINDKINFRTVTGNEHSVNLKILKIFYKIIQSFYKNKSKKELFSWKGLIVITWISFLKFIFQCKFLSLGSGG